MEKTVLVTGAGSGVGRAMAIRLVKEGWQVGLVGRREKLLQETAEMSGNSATTLVHACDVADETAVAQMTQAMLAKFGTIEVLVNAAGTNIPARSLTALSNADYRRVVEANMNGAFYCVQAFLPQMREHKSGTIVNINSVAGLKAGPVAGTAYAMSKFGMRALSEAINAEERSNGIRSCSIYPAEINTPIMDLRPNPPSQEARQQMLQPEDIVDCAMLVINLPARAWVEEIVIRPK